MSIELASSEISRFLNSDFPETLCITGKWGVGKTYAWKNFLECAQINNAIKLKKYSYVSLFGVNTLDDMRSSIVENSVPIEKASIGPDIETINEFLQYGAKKVTKYLGFVSHFQNHATSAARIAYALLAKHIICIDDLERSGKGITISDILGIVSQLKEQKKCKVVILLNSEKLVASDKINFDEQLEKVIDTFIRFEPSPTEAAQIGVSRQTDFCDHLSDCCISLGITNIRVIKKIERFVFQLEEILSNFDKRILRQAIHSAAIFCLSKYQPNEAPSIDLLRRCNKIRYGGEERSEDDSKWIDFMANYGFSSVDEFDEIILKGIDRGFFDRPTLCAAARDKSLALLLQDQHGSLEDAWSLYHDSFEDNLDKVIETINNSFRANVAAISLLNANSTVRFLKELGSEDLAKEIIGYYLDNRSESQEFWDMENTSFGSDLTDPDLVEGIRKKYSSFSLTLEDPGALLIKISKTQGYTVKQVEYLSKIEVNDYYKIFKNLRGSDMRRAVREALRFNSRGSSEGPERIIGARSRQALEMIASESVLNRRRVSQILRDI